MSFCKAKIVRYYDDVSCAPPPGKYDPKLETKVKGVILDKSQRFGTPKLENASSLESIDSACSSTKTPIFRTPSKRIPKKGPLSTPKSLKSRIPLPDKIHPNQLNDNDNKRLIEEINELTRVHQNQLLEKNEEIATLADQVNALNGELSKLMLSSINPVMKSEYEMEINKLRKELMDLNSSVAANEKKYKDRIEELQSQLLALEENLTNYVSFNKELEDSLIENSSLFQEINSKVTQMADDFNHQLNNYVESVGKVETINSELMNDYQCMLEQLHKESDESLQTKRSLMELQETVDKLKDDLATAHKRCKMYEVVQTETSKTINVLSKRLMESEVEVDHLNDVQQDLLLKKNQLEDQVKCLSEENHFIKENMESLQQSLRQEAEDLGNQLMVKLESYRQLAVTESEKQRNCITEKQNTIDMLLTEIDIYKNKKIEAEIQLLNCQSKLSEYQGEISIVKSTTLELEADFQEKIGAQKALFAQLSKDYDNLKEIFQKEKSCLEKQVSSLNKDKTVLEQQITDLELDLIQKNHKICQDQSKIKHLEDLTSKYDFDFDIVIKEYKDIIEEKTENIEELKRQIIEMELMAQEDKYLKMTVCDENEVEKLRLVVGEQLEKIQIFEYERIAQELSFQEFLDQKDELVKTIERQNREIAVLSETADRHYNAKRTLEQEINRLNEEKDQLKDSGNEDSMKVTSLEARIADLECRNRELTDIIGPFKSQLIQFDSERNFLLNKTENTEKELRALELEHAKSLGHQNHKQKIKHVVNLNETIATLKKEVEKYRLENIKLRHEMSSRKPSSFYELKKNKENKTKAQSKQRTKSPATALKDRNG